ncbi:ATP-binding protein, partial [Paenibacillus macerans]
MRLEKLQVSGFGHLHGLDVELPGPVTVLYGPNEAGKSTLLGFVRAML